MNKNTIISIVVSAALIIFAIVLTSGRTNNQSNNSDGKNTGTTQESTVNNVSIVPARPQDGAGGDGKQIIEIQAKGGYTPRKSIAKAGIPTVLRFNTNGTFDCSSSVRIPSMNIFKSLPQSGTTDIDLGTQKAGTLNGSCGMGMYPFEISFQ